MREFSAQLAHGLPGRSNRLRVDQVTNRLGLRKVHPAVSECPQAEFTRVGKPSAVRKAEVDHLTKHDRRAVTAYFYDILTCERVRSLKKCNDRVVNGFVRRRVDDLLEM